MTPTLPSRLPGRRDELNHPPPGSTNEEDEIRVFSKLDILQTRGCSEMLKLTLNKYHKPAIARRKPRCLK